MQIQRQHARHAPHGIEHRWKLELEVESALEPEPELQLELGLESDSGGSEMHGTTAAREEQSDPESCRFQNLAASSVCGWSEEKVCTFACTSTLMLVYVDS